MKIELPGLIPVAAVAASLAAGDALAHHSHGVRAPILQTVEVDGRIDEWPSSLPRYSFDRRDWPADLRRQVPDQHRPGAFFVTGHDPDTGMLYLAVVVEDDHVVRGSRWNDTDGVEVYLSRPAHGQDRTRQFVMLPGNGGGGEASHGHGMRWRASGARGAYSYEDGVLTYEWAFDMTDLDRGGAPVALAAGEELGFDVVLLDRSRDGAFRWVPWGTADTGKVTSSRVGRLLLTGEAATAPAMAWLPGAVLAAWPWLALLAGAGALVLFARRRPRAGLAERLDAVERRLTDTQDVVICLSEKFDHLEARLREGDGAPIPGAGPRP